MLEGKELAFEINHVEEVEENAAEGAGEATSTPQTSTAQSHDHPVLVLLLFLILHPLHHQAVMKRLKRMLNSSIL